MHSIAPGTKYMHAAGAVQSMLHCNNVKLTRSPKLENLNGMKLTFLELLVSAYN